MDNFGYLISMLGSFTKIIRFYVFSSRDKFLYCLFFFFFYKQTPRGNYFINASLKDQVDKHQEYLEDQTPSKQEKDF